MIETRVLAVHANVRRSHLRFVQHGVRWFDGKKINEDYEESEKKKFGYLLQDNSDDSDSSDSD